jgi:catechol 2,3-dioxygenase-like lactoylglutathione lyase family enzyme
MRGMIGSLYSVIIDCPEPRALAEFYSKLLGWPVKGDDEDWVWVGDKAPHLAFQRAPDHRPPRWPDPEFPQQYHVDVLVDDVEQAEREVLALGATRLPGEGEDFRVYADPAGHPFCLIWKVDS